MLGTVFELGHHFFLKLYPHVLRFGVGFFFSVCGFLIAMHTSYSQGFVFTLGGNVYSLPPAETQRQRLVGEQGSAGISG